MRAIFGGMVFTFFAAGSVGRGDVVHVDRLATGNGDGTSWCDAFIHLQDALAAPLPEGKVQREIRVADGTYKPDQGGGNVSGDALAAFRLLDGVTVSGGFAGCGASNPDERDPGRFPTVLSGDLAGDDQVNFANYEDNSVHVVIGSGVSSTAILDGFQIVGGNGDGGGLFVNRGSPIVRHCTFRSNRGGYGGAAFVVGSGSNVSFVDCIFLANKGVNGGAIFADRKVRVERGFFVGNQADAGGAIRLLEGGDATIRESIFASNSATNGGGAVYGSQDVTCNIDRCMLVGNQSDRGGGLHGREARFTITNSLLLGNRANLGGGLFINECFEGRQIVNTSIIGNLAEFGGGIYGDSCSFEDDYALVNSIVWDNRADQGAQIALDGCAIGHDRFDISHCNLQGGVEGLFVGDGWTLMNGEGNQGIDPEFSLSPIGTWTHAGVFDGNLLQTTLKDVAARRPDGILTGKVIRPDATDPLAFLIAGNSGPLITVWGDASQLGREGVSYALVNPRLGLLSPCVDAGSDATSFGDLDLDGRGRVLGADVDLGAYEVGDCDINGALDANDIADGIAADCDGNFIPDVCDLSSGLVEDCTLNGIPDHCEGAAACDSDGDGVPDDEDACADSDISAEIFIEDCHTDIENQVTHKGCTMADQLSKCDPKSKTRGQFVRCVGSLARDWLSDDLITRRERVRLVSCAARQ